MDEATYIAISDQYMPSFFRTAYSITQNRQDAEDAVQQALLNAWKARSKAHEGMEHAFMMRILINECYNILRRRKHTPPFRDMCFPSSNAPDLPDLRLYEAIQRLPETLKTPFLLKYMEEMTEKEVAAVLHLPVSSVKNRLFRAIKALQKYLSEEVLP